MNNYNRRKEIGSKKGQSVLEAALAADVFIPIFAAIRTLKPRRLPPVLRGNRRRQQGGPGM